MDEATLLQAYGLRPWDGRLPERPEDIAPGLLCPVCRLVRVPVAKTSGICYGCEEDDRRDAANKVQGA